MERMWDGYALEAMRIASRGSDKERGAAAALMLLERAAWDMADKETIEGNLKKLMGDRKELPIGFYYSWDSKSRVFKVGFDRDAYRLHGHLLLKVMINKMNSMGWPFFSGPKWDCWVGYFPRPVYGPVFYENMAQAPMIEENEKTDEPVIEAAKQEFKSRTIRRRAE